MVLRSRSSRALLAALLALAGLCLARPASAGEGDKEGAYWFASFLGGAAVPTYSMGRSRKEGLATLARFGLTGKSGFGLAAGIEYSPLPYDVADPATTVTSHFGLVTLAPRFTLGHGTLRAWVSAGGGVALERTTTTMRGMEVGSDTFVEPAVVGRGGVELHFFNNGGLTVSGGYARSFGDDLETHLASVLAGLVFTFQ